MELINVDLYEYFHLPRGENKGGMLTGILHSNSPEINAERKYPAMLVLPGGGYAYCSDREGFPIAERYYVAGYNAYILRYSCTPSRYPMQICEAAMAAAYIRREGERQNFSGSLAAAGFSAGGHLCGHLATVRDEDLKSVRISADDARPNAAILAYSVVSPDFGNGGTFVNLCGGDKALEKQLTIDERIDKATPPLFVFHTVDDGCVNANQALLLGRAAREHGITFELHIFSSGQHGLSACDQSVYRADNIPAQSSDAKKWIELSVAFLSDIGFKIED